MLTLAASALPLTVFAMASVAMSLHDARHQRIPNSLAFSALAAQLGSMVAFSALSTWVLGPESANASLLLDNLLRAILAGVICFAGVLLMAVIYPPGLGGGDVKLAALVGSMLGWLSWLHVLLASMLTLVFVGVLAIGHIFGRGARAQSARIPVAPLVFLASWVVIVSIGLVAAF